MKVLVVGAGMAGVTAALCFGRKGHEVQVFERKSLFQPAGTGIDVRPNAMRIMKDWNIERDLERIGQQPGGSSLRDASSGFIVRRSAIKDASAFHGYGTWRDRLIEVMYKHASAIGTVHFHFGTAVIDVQDDLHVASLVLGDGSKVEGDLILVADGITSQLRRKVLSDLPEDTEPISSRSTLYPLRISVDENILQNADLRRLVDQVDLNFWIGDDTYVVSRYNSEQDTLSIGYGIRAETDQTDMWDTKADLDYLRSRWKDACSELRSALYLADSCGRWKLAYLPKLSRWTSKDGRVVLIGDSIHAMVPNAGQAYSQTVEDLGVLELLVSRSKEAVTNMSAITSVWQAIRKPRVDLIIDYALFCNRLFMGGKPPQAKEDAESTDVKSLKHVIPNPDADFLSDEFTKWALDYDAIDEAENYLKANDVRL